MNRPKTVFVDRDGVVNRKRPEGQYVNALSDFDLLPGSLEALAGFTRSGIKVVVVTNQQGVAKGVTDENVLAQIHSQLSAEVEAAGGRISQIQVCNHLAGSCDCRKPDVGLFEQARALDPEIDFGESAVIGDSESDIEAAHRIGARAVLVTGQSGGAVRPDGTAEVADLSEALAVLTEPDLV